MSLESIFLEAEPRSRPQNSAAALQFHDAARKLHLAQIPSVTDHESNIDEDSARLWLQASATFSPERISQQSSRSYNTPRHSRMSNTPQERDITSARRSRLHVLGENDADDYLPPAKREDNVFGSPTFKIRPQATDTESTARNIARRHNFSRPTRPPRLYAISDPDVPHALHGVPTLAATTRASVHSKDHTTLSLARDSALTLTEPTDGLYNETNQQHIPTTAANMPLETPQQPLRQDYLDGRDVVFTSLDPTQNSGRLPTQSRLGESGQSRSDDLPDHIRESFDSAVTDSLGDGRAQLKRWEIWSVRLFFTLFVFSVNTALGLAYLRSYKHPYLLAILVFMKSKDILSTLAAILGMVRNSVHNKIWPPKQPRPKWILSLVCAYAETEEQIRKTVLSLVRGSLRPHRQAVCVILDGKPIDLLTKIFVIQTTTTLPYTTWKRERGELNIHAGRIEGTAVILIEKKRNAGKKDSLILGHDLFNYPREDMPHSTKLLRQELWKTIIPSIVSNERLTAFDYIFCTDADSTIHDQALRKLADALCRENNAIAACGVLFAEFGKAKTEYSMWHLFQQFQYTFGQYVRRQAESMWGRVTCLPGVVTMIVIRPEMAHALSEYARPVTNRNIFLHQTQYLGTDRRLTYCMMSQNKHLRTIFVPDARSETVVPNGLSHYLSQRRRWASNAYFNDFWLALGPQQRLITRLFAFIDLVRLTLVFYRVFNTAFFLHGLVSHFYVEKIIPTLVVTKMPAAWYLVVVMIKEPFLRKRVHKLILGMCINQIISPILSVIVFVNVCFHIGSHAWGKTGVSTQGPAPGTVAAPLLQPKPAQPWTPRGLSKTIRTAIRGPVKQQPKQPLGTPQTAKQSRKEDTRAAVAPSQSPNVPHRVPSPEMLTNSRTPIASSTSVNTVDKGRNRAPSLTCTPAPAGSVRQNSYATPSSLIRRTPHHRKRAHSRLEPLSETPTKSKLSSHGPMAKNAHDE
ncbi:hypothetical protein LTR70_006495 [Exophiala xenobiotica]|nr:hypothetical protein LTR70_006495 [Exophiala xenobiotica]